ANGTDDDSDTVNFDYAWTVEGDPKGGNFNTLSSTHFSRDKEVICTATSKDAFGSGTALFDDLTISNTKPSITSVSISPTTAYTTSELLCTPSGWSDIDTDSPEYQYAWTKQVGGNGSFVAVGGDTATLASTHFAQTDVVVCTATPFNTTTGGPDPGTPVASSGRTITNRAPSLSEVTVTPITPYTTSTLACTPTGWSDDDEDSPGWHYAWSKQAGGTGEFVSVGTDSSTLASTNFAQTDVIVCEVTPDDGFDTGTPVASAGKTIGNRAPSISSVSISPSPAYTTDSLSCAATDWVDLDGDSAGYHYAWSKYVGGTGEAVGVGSDSSTLASTEFDPTDLVVCEVTPDDGFDTGTPISNNRTITNRLPSITSVSVTPDPAYTNTIVTCEPAGWSDDDSDTEGYQYAWSVQYDGTGSYYTVTGETTSTLGIIHYEQTDVVRCTATPYDGYGTGTPMNGIRSISNRAPSITSVSISPSPAYTNTQLSCTPTGWSDDDGDSAGYVYTWERQTGGTGDFVGVGSNSSVLATSNYAQTDVVRCTATPHDGYDAGTSRDTTRTISNRAPTTPIVSINSLPEAGTNNLVCTITTTSTDADGDTPTYTFEWELDGAAWGGSTATTSRTGDTILAGDLTGCDDWACRAVASDGYDQTASAWKSTFATSPFSTEDATADMVGLPSHSSVYPNQVRGFWFQAPTDFTMVGFRLPTNASTEVQNIDIVLFTSTPVSGSSTSDFERLACFRDIGGTSVIETDPIDILEGEYVGVLGARGTTTLYSSYGSGPYTSSISGQSVTLDRLYTNQEFYTALPTSIVPTSGWMGRVELWYESHDTCPQASGQPDVVGNLSAYGACWYMAAGGATCDEVCAAVGGQNLAYMVEDRWPDECSTVDPDGIAAMFYNRGNYAAWGSGGGSVCLSLGWGRADGHYGKCTTGSAACGAYPGQSNNYDDVMPVCACHRRRTHGPEHTFNGLTSEHFITQGGCSPTGTLGGDADYFCESFYGPDCVARPGYVAHTTPSSTYPKMHKGPGCSSTAGTAIPGTWCGDVACRIGDWSENTTGVGNIVCDCY
ncbi:MAG: hypothetical protein JRI25_18125, partial [Deltaproteobacteria bacterium]|nr:hypothetical protein [Deltaproteobacteria bacterium]